MIANGVRVISSELNNLSLDVSKMQPKAERPPLAPKSRLPLLHLTPSNEKRRTDSPDQGNSNPWLLKPQHEIPSTPPPTECRPLDFPRVTPTHP